MLDSDFYFSEIIPALNLGLQMSLKLIVPSAVLGFLLGIIVGTARVFGGKFINTLANAYVSLIRGVPLLLQLYFLYYALPAWGIKFSAYFSAVLSFILCSSAYHSEYIRGALLSISKGQIKAGQALGFSFFKILRYIIIPQAARRALPGCGNEIIYLIKYSSLAHMVTIYEITGVAKQEASTHFVYIEIFLTAGCYYLFLTSIATLLLNYIEKKVYIPGFGAR